MLQCCTSGVYLCGSDGSVSEGVAIHRLCIYAYAEPKQVAYRQQLLCKYAPDSVPKCMHAYFGTPPPLQLFWRFGV